MKTFFPFFALSALLLIPLAACEEKTPPQKAKDKINEAADETKEAAQKAADAAKEAGTKAGDKIDETVH